MNRSDILIANIALKILDEKGVPDEWRAHLFGILNSNDSPWHWQLSQYIIDLLSEAFIALQFGFDYPNYNFPFNDRGELRQTLSMHTESSKF